MSAQSYFKNEKRGMPPPLGALSSYPCLTSLYDDSSSSYFFSHPTNIRPTDIPKVSDIYKLLIFDSNETLLTLYPLCSMRSALKVDHTNTLKETSNTGVVTAPSYIPKAPYPNFKSIETWHTRSLVDMKAVHHVCSYLPAQSQTHKKLDNNLGILDVKCHPCQFPGCQIRFKRFEHLKRHFRVHTLERPYSCKVEGCGKSFSRRDDLGQHMKTHRRKHGSLKSNMTE